MSTRIQNHVTGRLSLRPPQADSLGALVRALDAAPEMLGKQRDVGAILSTLKAQFPTLEDFEREFPSLCFALATGVGKTRLMGAFIAYLHLAHGIRNFFVLAPNLTIYDKLIADFTPNTAKYVFKGIGEFAINAPRVITGDNYDQQNVTGGELFGEIRINIFNISKINSEVRGGKEPRIKRMREVLGDSYFNHLANLPDLVLLMDESHRYRAQAGMRAINELDPLFGLELTATPFVESGKGQVPFKNVVVDYPLARAMADGFVKEPAVVTQRNFRAADHTPEQLERIKLEDGVRLHESTKAELLTYARENGVKAIKPFVLVIARDTSHAGQLKSLIESEAFHGGRYRDKVIQVDSSRSGAEEEAMIQALLNVESADESTEIVIHVNMLKEGWDVTNLYTIVPLRAANARTLIEQSIGRGLRLPYGERTGVEAVDRLSIVAHDRFQEIVDEANRGDSPIRMKQLILEAPGDDAPTVSVQVQPNGWARLGLGDGPTIPASLAGGDGSASALRSAVAPDPVLVTEAEIDVARVVREVIATYEARPSLAPTSAALLQEGLQNEIREEVRKRLSPTQGQLLEGVDDQAPQVDLTRVVDTVTRTMVGQTIDIPRIALVPAGEVTSGFRPFTLGPLPNYQPGQREIVIQALRTSTRTTLIGETGVRERRPEDYLVKALVDFDDVDYFSQSDLLYDLAGQAVAYYRSQGHSEDELHQILSAHGGELGRLIHAQMAEHAWEEASGGYDVKVSRGFTELRACNYTAAAGQPIRDLRETIDDRGGIKRMLFGGFKRCLYPLQKFHSDTERRFALLLERDALKWFKPAKGQFQIYYTVGHEQPEYVPDFVAELDDRILMVETKARTDMDSHDVRAKAVAAATWCRHATEFSVAAGGKPWAYLLVPHDEVDESRQVVDFKRFEIRHPVGSTV